MLLAALLLALMAALLAIILISPGPSERNPPAPIVGPLPTPRRRPFQPGEETVYEISWNGMPCADCRLTVAEEEKDGVKRLVLDYEGSTRSELAWLWSYQIQGKTYLDERTLLPTLATAAVKKKGKAKNITVTFDRPASTARSTPSGTR